MSSNCNCCTHPGLDCCDSSHCWLCGQLWGEGVGSWGVRLHPFSWQLGQVPLLHNHLLCKCFLTGQYSWHYRARWAMRESRGCKEQGAKLRKGATCQYIGERWELTPHVDGRPLACPCAKELSQWSNLHALCIRIVFALGTHEERLQLRTFTLQFAVRNVSWAPVVSVQRGCEWAGDSPWNTSWCMLINALYSVCWGQIAHRRKQRKTLKRS